MWTCRPDKQVVHQGSVVELVQMPFCLLVDENCNKKTLKRVSVLRNKQLRGLQRSANNLCVNQPLWPSPAALCSCRWAGDCVPSRGELPQHHQQQHVFLGPAGPLCQNRVSQQGGDGRRTQKGPQGALHVVRVRHPEARTSVYSQILPSWGGRNLAEHLQGGHCAAPLSQGRRTDTHTHT